MVNCNSSGRSLRWRASSRTCAPLSNFGIVKQSNGERRQRLHCSHGPRLSKGAHALPFQTGAQNVIAGRTGATDSELKRQFMIPTLITLAILGGLVLLVFLFVAGGYNKLVTLRNRFKNAFSQIDVQLKRRYDLIPNLVETAKGYLQHERGTLEAVISARNAASAASSRAAEKPGDA